MILGTAIQASASHYPLTPKADPENARLAPQSIPFASEWVASSR